jgi:hypothetical protein
MENNGEEDFTANDDESNNLKVETELEEYPFL